MKKVVVIFMGFMFCAALMAQVKSHSSFQPYLYTTPHYDSHHFRHHCYFKNKKCFEKKRKNFMLFIGLNGEILLFMWGNSHFPIYTIFNMHNIWEPYFGGLFGRYYGTTQIAY